jgi:GntR family transcriptional regulator
MGPGSLYARFEDLGHEIKHVREEVTARVPTHEEATGLQIPDGVPVLDLLHTGVDQNGDPFEVTRFILRADFTALDYFMPVEE